MKSPGVWEREVGKGRAGGTSQRVASNFDRAGLEHPLVVWVGHPVQCRARVLGDGQSQINTSGSHQPFVETGNIVQDEAARMKNTEGNAGIAV